MWCAWVQYHALSPEDINYLWLADTLEYNPRDLKGAVHVSLGGGGQGRLCRCATSWVRSSASALPCIGHTCSAVQMG